jgi:catechol 2,3-dioxygenase-like lactoylglutathione lyase family enzyme
MFGSLFGSQEKDQGQGGDFSPGLVAILPVSDMASAQRFFERLGFRPDYGDEEYAILSNEQGAQVHLKRAGPSFLKPANPFGLYLYTQDVDRLAAEFRDEILGPSRRPERTEWGTYEFSVNGPDGIVIQVGWPTEE